MYFVYLLRCKDNSLYCGITRNVTARVAQHNAGTGSKYVHSRGGGIIIFTEQCADKSTALQREAAIKKLSKSQKELLIRS